MRRRVVCPRSHPASPYLRRPLGRLRHRSQCFSGGMPPGPPLSPYRAPGGLGGCHLRGLASLATCGGMLRGAAGAACCYAASPLARRWGAAGRSRGIAGAGGRVWPAGQPVPWRAAVPGRVPAASLGNTEPGVTTRSGHFRSQSIARSVWPNRQVKRVPYLLFLSYLRANYSGLLNVTMATPIMTSPMTATIPSDKPIGTTQPPHVMPGDRACMASSLRFRWVNTAWRIGPTT